MRMLLTITTLLFLLVGCISNGIPSEPTEIYNGKTATIKYDGQVQNNDWIRIDTFLFIHKNSFYLEANKFAIFDSVATDGKIIRYRILPTSENTIQLGNEEKTEKLTPTVILTQLVEHLGLINDRRPQYRLNIGSRLWLGHELEISTGDDEENISIEIPFDYPAVITNTKN